MSFTLKSNFCCNFCCNICFYLKGDSGSPLMMQRQDGKWVNIGIVSWGIGCGNPAYPGVYTKVASYLKWISVTARFED